MSNLETQKVIKNTNNKNDKKRGTKTLQFVRCNNYR